MNRRFWALVLLFACAPLGLAGMFSEAAAKAPKKDAKDKRAADKDAAKDVFGLTKVWHFDLQISAKEWDKIQPTGGMRFPGFGGPAAPEKPAENPKDVHKGSGFGMEFPWVDGAFSVDGKTWKHVGVRYKGNASYMASARGLKRNFKIELDHFDTELRF